MESDATLTAAFVDGHAEPALRALVDRYIDLVYSAALRQVGGDVHLAQDVAQIVFAEYVRQCGALRGRESLAGWYYTTSHHVAAKVVRTERRRKAREQEAIAMDANARDDNGAVDWELARPVLDSAMHELSEVDREALVLRYFERRPVAEIGARLDVAENAAAKRIERALERLRDRLAKRGITSAAAGLAVALETQSVIAAPAGLATAVTASALTGTAAAVAGAVGTIAFMSTAKMTVGLVALAVVAGGGAYVLRGRATQARAELSATTEQVGVLRKKVADAEASIAAARRRVTSVEDINRTMLAEAQTAKLQLASDGTPITDEVVSARFRKAQQAMAAHDDATALKELLWCYNIGMPRISGMSAVRSTSIGMFGELAARHEPANTALRQIRDAAEARVKVSVDDYDAVDELARCNHALHDDAANFAWLDGLPKGDRRRQEIAMSSYEELLVAQRYADAVDGMPFAFVSSSFERMKAELRNTDGRPGLRDQFVSTTLNGIEALAGAGDATHARDLAERLLAVDGSDAMRRQVQSRLERAGHPGLLGATDK